MVCDYLLLLFYARFEEKHEIEHILHNVDILGLMR